MHLVFTVISNDVLLKQSFGTTGTGKPLCCSKVTHWTTATVAGRVLLSHLNALNLVLSMFLFIRMNNWEYIHTVLSLDATCTYITDKPIISHYLASICTKTISTIQLQFTQLLAYISANNHIFSSSKSYLQFLTLFRKCPHFTICATFSCAIKNSQFQWLQSAS
jgi:hypothetical protein